MVRLIMIAAAFFCGWISLAQADANRPISDLEALKKTYLRPKTVPFPADNPYTADKAALGKALFFDPRLSKEGNTNCMACHNPSFGWTDGQSKSVGSRGMVGVRHSPSILNVAWGKSFFWDGRAATLEEQAISPIMNPVEMNMPLEDLVKVLKDVPGYVAWFERVFPGEGITQKTIAQALATFERTIVSGWAPFDAWIEGDESAISESAKRGFLIFNGKADCAHCHSGWTFSDEEFYNIGLGDDDLGKGGLPNTSVKDKHLFKTPGLRNIRQRAPYMHDGAIDSIEGVIMHYAGGGNPSPTLSEKMEAFTLTEQEMTDLIAFLDSLTGEDTPMPLPVLPR